MKNNQVICIEGLDRLGKDTLRRHLVKESQGRFLVIVRSFISQIAYSRIYKRNIDEQWFINSALEWQKLGHAFIYLTANSDLIKQRIIDTNEQDINEDDIEYHSKIFLEVIDLFKINGLKILTVDVSSQNLDKFYKQINKHINEQ